MKRILLINLFTAICVGVSAQNIRSNGAGGGDWNSPASWEGGVVPNYANSTSLVIRPSDVINIPNGLTVQADQMIIQSTGTVNVLAGGVLEILNGGSTDLRIASGGFLNISGRMELSHNATHTGTSAVSVNVLNGGVYEHKYQNAGGVVIGATWQDGARLEFTGFTSSFVSPTNLAQSFYDVVWNCPLQTSYRIISGLTNVRNDLIIMNTGSSQVRLFDGLSDRTTNVGDDLIVLGNASLHINRSGDNNTLNIAGDFVYTSSNFSQFTQTGDVTVNIGGNFTHSGAGELRFGASGGIINVNLYGDLNINGFINSVFSAVTNFRFVGNTTHNFVRTVGYSGFFNYEVLSGNTLNLGVYSLIGSGTLILRNGARLNAGAYNGNGTDGNGAIQNSTTQGNVRLAPSRRFYEAGSLIGYSGNSAQDVGTTPPINENVHVVFDNPASVSIGTIFTAASVTIEQGNVIANNHFATNSDFVMNGGTFSGGNSIVYFNGPGAILGAAPKTFHSIRVTSIASLTLPAEVSLSGDFTLISGGNINPNSGNVTFIGNIEQSISLLSEELNNITIAKTGGAVSLASALNLRGTLQINSATTFNSDGFLTLLSTQATPSNDGSIGTLVNGASVSGNVNIQRYMSAKGNVNRYISSPITALPVSMLQDDFSITGPFAGTSYPCTVCSNNGASLKWFRENLVNQPSGVRFRGFPVSSNAETLVVGRGYAAYQWQNKVNNVDISGIINSGTINFAVTRVFSTPAITNSDGWNLIGNPYPSPILWDGGPGWALSNISPTVSVPDAGVQRTYNYFDDTGDLPGGIIAMGQGFWVFATAASPALQINENAKTNLKTGSYYREPQSTKSEQLIISLEGESLRMSTFLKLNPEATEDFDPYFDAIKVPNELQNISLGDASGSNLLMHTVSEIDESAEIPVIVEVSSGGEYIISFTNAENFSAASGLYLLDKLNHSATKVDAGTSYVFAVTEAASITDRFVLTYNPAAEQRLENTVSIYPNPFTNQITIQLHAAEDASVEIIDVTGKSMLKQDFNRQVSLETAALRTGVYLARVKTSAGLVVKKIIKN